MEKLRIEATKSTPIVDFNPNTHVHSVIGESYPENSREFYNPLMNWIRQYLDSVKKSQHIVFNFEMIYFNSSSSKALLDLFYLLDDYAVDGERKIVLNWIYISENEAAEEYGTEFSEDVKHLKFNLIKKDESNNLSSRFKIQVKQN